MNPFLDFVEEIYAAVGSPEGCSSQIHSFLKVYRDDLDELTLDMLLSVSAIDASRLIFLKVRGVDKVLVGLQFMLLDLCSLSLPTQTIERLIPFSLEKKKLTND